MTERDHAYHHARAAAERAAAAKATSEAARTIHLALAQLHADRVPQRAVPAPRRWQRQGASVRSSLVDHEDAGRASPPAI